jgi:hypothetical protein
LRLVLLALLLPVLAALPLLLVGLLDPAANPIGLGLLFMAGVAIAAVLLLVAAVRAACSWLRPGPWR